MEIEQSQSKEDSQDVMDWGEKTKRMTDQGTKVEARVPEPGVPEGITSLESCSGQVGGLYGCQDTANVPEGCQGGISILDGDQVNEQVHGEGGGRVVAPGGEGGVGDGQGGEAKDDHPQEEDKIHEQVQGEGRGACHGTR